MASLPPADWMAALDGELDLTLITIPGTHDSCSRLGGSRKQTQTLDLAGQLAAGVRFFDIRLKDDAGVFRAVHDDVDQQLEFEAGALAAMQGFLAGHPGEALVVSVKREGAGGDDATFARDFEALTVRHAADFHLGPDFPRLGDVRGRIVLMRRYGGGSAGIAADPARWPSNATATIATDAGSLTVEDAWDLGHSPTGLEDKWAAVSANLEAAAGSAFGWYLTFTSAVHDLMTPGWIAGGPPMLPLDGINQRLVDYLAAHPGHRRLGTVVMDFPELPDARLVQGLVDANL